MKYMNAVKKFGAGAVGVGASALAVAAPDPATITSGIESATPVVDAAGGSMISVFIGLMVFSIIIGMLLRKGK